MFKHVFAGRNGTIYAINQQGELIWFRYLGFPDGSLQWERTAGVTIGSGWGGFHRVMASNDGVLYAIHPNGDLYWYKHLGHETGAGTWANGGSGLLVGTGWGQPARVTAADDGVLYLLRENGELLWYQHTGFRDGTKTWTGPVLIHSGFDQFDTVEASSDGVLYCRKDEYDELYWYKHLGYKTGAASWADYKHVGTGWNAFGRFTASNAGVIYVVTSQGQLRWYQHTGFASGAMSWQQADLGTGFGAQVALHNSGYLGADPSRGNQLFCASESLGDSERFLLIYLDEKKVALQTPSGSYVGVDTQTAGAPLFANRGQIGAAEKFTLKEIVVDGRTGYELTASNGRQLIVDWGTGGENRVLANGQPNVGSPSWNIEDHTPPLSLPPVILANMPALREVWTERLETGVWTDPYYSYSTRTYQEAYADHWRQLYVGFVAYDTPQRGTIPIYRQTRTFGNVTLCRLASIAVTQPDPDGWRQVGVAFHAYASQMAGTVPVYHETGDGFDFYSVRPREAALQSGWTQQGVAFYAYPADLLRPYPRIVLQDAATEKYIHLDRSATNNLVARRAAIGGAEPLFVIYLGQGRLALQTSTGMYVSAASAQGLVANAPSITGTEIFTCYEANVRTSWNQGVPSSMNLQASNGGWLRVDAQGNLVATGTSAPTAQTSTFLTGPVPQTDVGAEALVEVHEDASLNGPNLFKYTTDATVAAGSGWERRGVAFAAYASAQPGTVPIHLETPASNPGSYYHLWHRTVAEAQQLGWVQQGVAFHAFMWQAPGTIPVYRDEKNSRFRFTTRSDVAAAEAGFNRWDIAFYAYPAEAMQQRFVKIRSPIMNLQLEAQNGKVYQNTPSDHWPGRNIEVRPEPSGGVRLLCYDGKHIACEETGALQITTDPTRPSGVFEIEPVGNSSRFRLRAASGKVVCFGPQSSDFLAVQAESQAVLQSGSGYRWDQHTVLEWVPYSSALVPLEVEHKLPAPSGPEPSGAEVRQRILTARATAPAAEQAVLDAALAFLDEDLNLPVASLRVSVNPNLVAGLLFSLNREAVRVLSLCAGGIDWRSYASADENPLWVQYKTLMMTRKAVKVQKLLDEFKEPKNAKMAKSTKFLKLFKAIVGGPLKVYFMTVGTAMIELSAADVERGGAGGCQILMPWATPGIFIPFPPNFIKEDEQFTWTDLARATNPYAQQFVTRVNELYTQSAGGLQTGSNWIKSMYVTEAARVTEMLQGIGNPAFVNAEVAAKNLRAMGYGATEAVQGIVGVYNTTAQQTANVLKSAGYAGEQIASSLKGTYDLTKTGVEQTIENAGIGLGTAVTTVGTGLTAGATTVGSWIAGLFRA